MSASPTVSVVIPTHNRPLLLSRAIDSVLQQTYRDFEIIIIDDGEEGVEGCVQEYASRADVEVRYISTSKNEGGAAARNRGIREARGEYLALLDDDDRWYPDKLACQVAVLDEHPDAGFVYCLVEQRYEESGRVAVQPVPVGEDVHNFYEDLLAHRVRILTSSLLIRRKVLEDTGGFDETFPSSQEWELMIRVSERHDGFCLKEVLVTMAVLAGEHIGGSLERRIAGRERLVEKHYAALSQRPRALAHHYFQLGVFNRDVGRYDRARSYFLHAWQTQPFHFRPLVHALLMFSDGKLYRLIRR